MQVGLVFFGCSRRQPPFSDSTGTLIATRALMGVAAAFIFPASLAILTSVFTDPSERQKALGIWGATSGIAVAFGPIVGGALLEHFWYGSIFLVNVPIVVVTLIAGGLVIPRLPRVRQHPFDLRGVVVSTAGILLLVLAIIEGPQWGWASAGTLACFAGAAVLLTAFTLLELRTEGPLLDVRVFKIPRFTGGALSISVAFFCLFGFIFLITQYFQFVKGYSTLSAGLHTLPFAIVAAIFTPIAAVVALRVGTRLVVTVGLLLMGSGLVVTAFNSSEDTTYFGPIIIAMVLLALGLSSITAPTAEAVMGSVSDEQTRRRRRCQQHDPGAGRHTRGGSLRLHLRLVLRTEDHQCVPPAADPGGTQGRGARVDGRRVGGGRPRAACGTARAGRRRLQRLPQRIAGGVHRGCRCGGARCAGGGQVAARAWCAGSAVGGRGCVVGLGIRFRLGLRIPVSTLTAIRSTCRTCRLESLLECRSLV